MRNETVTIVRRDASLRPWLQGTARFIKRKPLGAIGGAIVFLLIFTGLFGGAFAPHSYDFIDLHSRLLTPTVAHPFGTDSQGRDILSRIIFGARTSIFIGFGSVAMAVTIASLLGVTSAYYGGRFDLLIQRVVDIWQSFPGLIFVIFLLTVFGRGTPALIIVIGTLFAAGSTRIIRSATLALMQNSYIEAAKSLGAGDARIIAQHLIPNVVPIIIIGASIQVGAAIILESSLSFLGYGSPPPFPSWGRMLQESQRDMQYYPHLAIFPGAAIALAVYSFNMFGDALRDVLDPRLRGSR